MDSETDDDTATDESPLAEDPKRAKAREYEARYREKNKMKLRETNKTNRQKKVADNRNRIVSVRAENTLKIGELMNDGEFIKSYDAAFEFRQQLIYGAEKSIQQHDCGPMNNLCQYCGSKNFKFEKVNGKFQLCCLAGKLRLHPKRSFPNELMRMMIDPSHQNHKNFFENIRSFNSALSMTSLGTKSMSAGGNGPTVIKLHGVVFHLTNAAMENSQSNNKSYNQLYFVDTEEANSHRISHPANEKCAIEIFDLLDRFLRANNLYAQSYKMMHEVEKEQKRIAETNQESLPSVSLVFRKDARSDQRRFNLPNSNAIAAVFVNADGEPPFERDFQVYARPSSEDSSRNLINLSLWSPHLEAMTYPLLNPYGEQGWHLNWEYEPYEGVSKNPKRNKVSMLQYTSALLSIRDYFEPRLHAGKLTQQWITDMYTQCVTSNLEYLRRHQPDLKSSNYKGLQDYIAGDDAPNPGVRLILPSTFEGSPRNMREKCADAMSIFAKLGPPDLFITMTANRDWPEITAILKEYGEIVENRPDIVDRVFYGKSKELVDLVCKQNYLGICIAYAYTIEFQKRGMPHMHLLVTLHPDFKFTTPERVDEVVSAELPNKVKNPRLHEIVKKVMIHGPCGNHNPKSPCMRDGECSKKFPKRFNEETTCSDNGYAEYRRRSEQQFIAVGTTMLDNRNVVPYNPELLLMFNCHINVEVCTGLKAVKYIYSYLYKGFDCIDIKLHQTNNNPLDEITSFASARYVSPQEACWHIRQYKTHDHSHTVVRLPVHLEDLQQITYRAGEEELAANRNKNTKLMAWYELNSSNSSARKYNYTEIPSHFTWNDAQHEWKERKRGHEKVIARMYQVNIRDRERHALRILLLHVPGATSFEFLRTVDSHVYGTFREAAEKRHLLESDEIWDDCLSDAATFLMAPQMRETFAYICIFNQPSNVLILWAKHYESMCQDFTNPKRKGGPMSSSDAMNAALHDLQNILTQHGLSCSQFCLPTPTGKCDIQWNLQCDFDIDEQRQYAEKYIPLLNQKQKIAYDKIMSAVNDSLERDRLIFLDGPGGSGKSFLIEAILAKLRSESLIALPFAYTGIAARLLKGGKTIHSGFRLPVPILENSTSSMTVDSPEAVLLKNAGIIIIDEVSMLTRHALRCIDMLLQDVMDKKNHPFGGKVVVLTGDFRQTLPVVSNAPKNVIIDSTLKASSLFRLFTQISLSENMRSNGQDLHNKWLLEIGNGAVGNNFNLGEDVIEVPSKMIIDDDIVDAVYGQISDLSFEQLKSRVILSPKNVDILEMNRKIISALPGEITIYNSFDSIVSEDPDDEMNYPVEILNDMTPSGMPPHVLALKKNAVIMLLRNLNPQKGLCNGTRLRVIELHDHSILARVLDSHDEGTPVLIPRLILIPSDTKLPFKLRRIQFPVTPAYAMTINKAQGQSFDFVGIHLKQPVFSHGQLYVALSRSRNEHNIKIKIENTSRQGITNKLPSDRRFTQNVVYKEVLN